MPEIPQNIDDKTALIIIDVQKGFMNEHTQHLPLCIAPLQDYYPSIIITKFYNAVLKLLQKAIGEEQIRERKS